MERGELNTLSEIHSSPEDDCEVLGSTPIGIPEDHEQSSSYAWMFLSSIFKMTMIFSPGFWLRDLTREGVEPNPGPKGKGKGKKVAIAVIEKKVKKPKSQKQRSDSGFSIDPNNIGRSLGSSVGGWVGGLASKFLGKITGLGDYKVAKNSIIGNSPPAFMNGGGCVSIAHREFLGLVNSPGAAFTTTSYPLNPFNSDTFPWLAEIAASFETFQFKGLVFEFKSTYGDAIASTNAALGSVILATQYNASAPAFTSQIQMENYQYATSTKPSVSMIHPVECDPSQLPVEHLYVYNQNGNDQDPRWANLGVTTIATVGQQAAAVVGELWCSYDIEFYQPKLLSGTSSNGLGAHYRWTPSYVTATAAPTALLVGGLTPQNLRAGDLQLTAETSSAGEALVFPIGLTGVYFIQLVLSTNNASSTSADVPTAPNPYNSTIIWPNPTDNSYGLLNAWPGPPGGNTSNLLGTYVNTAAGPGTVAFRKISTIMVHLNDSLSINSKVLFTAAGLQGYTSPTGVPVTVDLFCYAVPTFG